MALTKSATENGTVYPTAYYKITGEDYSEGRVGEDGTKYYICNLAVTCYTDSTKEFTLDSSISLGTMRQDFVEADKTLAAHYAWLKTLDVFSGATDA